MANLIITIISIALVAVAALMGAYYGGTAYIEGQTKAQVNQATNMLNQVAAAVTLYQIDRNTQNFPSGAVYSTAVPTYLVPQYLSSLAWNGIFRTSSQGGYYLYGYTSGTNLNSDIVNTPVVIVGIYLSLDNPALAAKVCQKFSEMAHGDNSGLTAFGTSQPTLATKKKLCMYVDTDASGTPTSGDTNFMLLYKFS